MAKKKKVHDLPQLLFVRRDGTCGEEFLSAFENGCMEAVEDDGPTIVGVYKLTKVYPQVCKTVYLGEPVEV